MRQWPVAFGINNDGRDPVIGDVHACGADMIDGLVQSTSERIARKR